LNKHADRIKGIIIKGYSGFYYVWDGETEWECNLRGRFRLTKQTFLPGDRVAITVVDKSRRKAVIEEVEPRKNELIRPPVANVDQVVIVMAVANPEPDCWLLDRLLVMAQANGVEPVICFNKYDLLTEGEESPADLYRNTGFPILATSTVTGLGLEELREILAGKVSVLAGPSGVGKSSLLNKIEGLRLKTGEVSEKTSRGRHTTRHVELMRLSSGGLLADTPGFSQVYLPKELKREELIKYYPDFLEYHSGCMFKTCLHREEPECAVRQAVEQGILPADRYQRYLSLLDEVIMEERRY